MQRREIVILEKLLSFDGKSGYFLRKLFEVFTQTRSTYDVTELSEWLELPVTALEEWIYGIPDGYEYQSFKIRKKSGRGLRKIDSPNPALKTLQRSVYHKLLKRLTVHKAASGFVPGKSIVDNALPHVGQTVVINIDLKDFFSNISLNRVYRFWRFLGWDVKSSTILTNICCHNKCLPQGAPTSPALSNLCNTLLDARLAGVVEVGNGQYTRYADDLTFSFPAFDDRHRRILRKIFQILNSEGYEIQKRKRVRIQRAHQRQITTGLIVNEKVNLPRTTRRKIRAMRHHLSNGTLSDRDLRRLEGYEGLLNMISSVNGDNKDESKSEKKVEILFLSANPIDSNRLQLDEEMRRIDDSLRRSKYREQFDLRSHWAVRTRDLQELLLRHQPTIVHFSGHGSSRSEIILQNEQGQSVSVPQKALSEMFRIFSSSVSCVILNACFSLKQAEAIAEHVPVVIGMSEVIKDETAIEFASAFYLALGYGRNIGEAFELACNSVELNDLRDADKPRLIGKDNLSIVGFLS